MPNSSPGAGWPSSTSNPSGGGRYNAPAGGRDDDDDDDDGDSPSSTCEYCHGTGQIFHQGHRQACPYC